MEERFDDEGMRRVEWAHRKARMRQQKQKQMLYRRLAKAGVAVAAVFIVASVIFAKACSGKPGKEGEGAEAGNPAREALENLQEVMGQIGERESADDVQGQGPEETEKGEPERVGNLSAGYRTATDTRSPLGSVVSGYVIFVDLEEGEILMRKDEKTRMNPASMTKVLTLLVAVEHIDDLDDTFTMTSEIMDYCLLNDCSTAGFERGDTVTVKDLLYGTVLPSGAEAALGLATYVSGSQEAFVELMNERLEEMGLSETTHFTNCVGIYDANHYSTVYDMAIIMENAIGNELCREVLSAHKYMTGGTKKHPEGIELSNLFLRRIEDKDTGGEVVCAKTGYVAQSQNCAVSYGEDGKGKGYICVTGGSTSPWRCIYDHADIYKYYMDSP